MIQREEAAARLLEENLGMLGYQTVRAADEEQALAAIIEMVSDGKLNRGTASKVFEAVFDNNGDPAAYVKDHGLEQINDTGLVESTVAEILAANPSQVIEYRGGKEKLFGFFVGQCMRALKGKADPKAVNEVLRRQLNG